MSRRKKNKQQSSQKSATAKASPPSTESQPRIPAGGAQKLAFVRIAQALLVVAFGISAYLGYSSLSSSQLAGCGADSTCNNVLSSRWAYWFGIPISVPAAFFYLLMLVGSIFCGPERTISVQRRSWQILVAGAFSILAAALWFTGLQGVIIGSWCKFCMAAHICGGSAAVLVLMAAPFVMRHNGDSPSPFGVGERAWPAILGILALVPMVIGQYLSSPAGATSVTLNEQTTQVETRPPEDENAEKPAPVDSSSGTTQTNAPAEAEKSRLFGLHGKFQFDLHSVPLMGNPEAPFVMVSLFDYTCSHCREMHERLVRIQKTYSDQLAIVLMPMPLDSTCNTLVKSTRPDHINACQYARIGLAVFKEQEEVFDEYEHWFFETPKPRSIQAAISKAKELTGQTDIEPVINHTGVEAWIQLGIQVFKTNYEKSGQGKLPMIMAGSGIMAGEVKSDEALIDFLVTNLGLPKKTGSNQ